MNINIHNDFRSKQEAKVGNWELGRFFALPSTIVFELPTDLIIYRDGKISPPLSQDHLPILSFTHSLLVCLQTSHSTPTVHFSPKSSTAHTGFRIRISHPIHPACACPRAPAPAPASTPSLTSVSPPPLPLPLPINAHPFPSDPLTSTIPSPAPPSRTLATWTRKSHISSSACFLARSRVRCDACSAVSTTMSRTMDARPLGRYFWEWEGPGGENELGRNAGPGAGGVGSRNLGGSEGGGGDEGEGPGMRKRG